MKPTRRRAKTPSRSRVGARKSTPRKSRTRKPKRTGKAPLDRRTVEALERQVRSLRIARGKLEHRLTAAVQEIGTLRHFELRVKILEGELQARDEEISRLRNQGDERLGAIAAAPS